MRKIFYILTIVFGISLIGFSFTIFPSAYAVCGANYTGTCYDTGNLPYRCGVDEIPLYLEHSFDLKKSTMPSGKMYSDVSGICLNEEKQILKISLFSAYFTTGQMTINIPRENLNPQTPSCEDDAFQIERHGKITSYEETKTDAFREITFPIMANDNTITIHVENPENTKSCDEKITELRTYTLEEALEIQRIRTGLPITNNPSPLNNTYPEELTAEMIEEMKEIAKRWNSPPLKQFRDYEIEPNNINCKAGLELILKNSDGSPSCVKPATAEKLIKRGWTNPL